MANRVITTTFWKDHYVVELEADEKLLFLYLLTNPLTNIAGIYEIGVREIVFDTGIEKKRVEMILAKFVKDEKIVYTRGWLALQNWIKHQATNPKVAIGINRIVENLPEWLKKELLEPEDPQVPLLQDSVSKPIDRLGKPIALNLTKLNLTKLNSTQPDKPADVESSKELSAQAPIPKTYARAVKADDEQKARVFQSRKRPKSKLEPVGLSEEELKKAYDRRTHKE